MLFKKYLQVSCSFLFVFTFVVVVLLLPVRLFYKLHTCIYCPASSFSCSLQLSMVGCSLCKQDLIVLTCAFSAKNIKCVCFLVQKLYRYIYIKLFFFFSLFFFFLLELG